jgi:alpha-ketoglutarate-dependent taurine dioxygenase
MLASPLAARGTGALPHVIPATDLTDLLAYVRQRKDFLRAQVLDVGAVLLRGFEPVGAPTFRAVTEEIVGPLTTYSERSSPRSELHPRVYTSTDYPAHSPIFLHNENSYQSRWPAFLSFYCGTAPEQGGETVVADVRRLTSALPVDVVERFRRVGWRYVRNLHDDLGLPWQEVFQTSDRASVAEYCASEQIACDWRGSSLRLSATRPALQPHPATGENLWFNHAAFFHPRSLPRETREALSDLFEPDDLPSNAYFGDGAVIPDPIMDVLTDTYLSCSDGVCWERGDLLVLDNMLVAHGRQPFAGDRLIMTAMSAASGIRAA